MHNYIFDLDGTIINSADEVLKCLKQSFLQAGYNINEYEFSSDLIGPPLKQIIKNIDKNLNEETKIKEIMQNFRTIYDNEKNDISRLYDGIFDYLQKLKREGKKLFIATFKPELPTQRILKQYKLDMFDDVYTIDKFGVQITKTEMICDIINKYKLERAKTIMIGDSSSDMTAAKEAGISSVGVLWGYGRDKTELLKNADFVINRIEELEQLKICL
ncbi:HAD family hydrolase [bacterium]|nr:HAD family hydrolase [bacterium]